MFVDFYMCLCMIDCKLYIVFFNLNEVMEVGVIGEVVELCNNDFLVGSKVSYISGWCIMYISDGSDLILLFSVLLFD